MLSAELISGVLGALGGYLMKYMALRAQDEKDRFERMMQAIDKSDESANKAAQRVPNDANGNWVRRFIVIAILFGVILAPFVLTLLNLPVVVEVMTPIKNIFGFSFGGVTKFYELNGYLMVPEIRQALICIISFYFGQSAAKR